MMMMMTIPGWRARAATPPPPPYRERREEELYQRHLVDEVDVIIRERAEVQGERDGEEGDYDGGGDLCGGARRDKLQHRGEQDLAEHLEQLEETSAGVVGGEDKAQAANEPLFLAHVRRQRVHVAIRDIVVACPGQLWARRNAAGREEHQERHEFVKRSLRSNQSGGAGNAT